MLLKTPYTWLDQITGRRRDVTVMLNPSRNDQSHEASHETSLSGHFHVPIRQAADILIPIGPASPSQGPTGNIKRLPVPCIGKDSTAEPSGSSGRSEEVSPTPPAIKTDGQRLQPSLPLQAVQIPAQLGDRPLQVPGAWGQISMVWAGTALRLNRTQTLLHMIRDQRSMRMGRDMPRHDRDLTQSPAHARFGRKPRTRRHPKLIRSLTHSLKGKSCAVRRHA